MKRCHRIGPYGGFRDNEGRKIVPPQARSTPPGTTTTQWKAARKAQSQMRAGHRTFGEWD